MRRTQIYITDEQERRIAQIAHDRKQAKAEVIRSILDEVLNLGDSEGEARSVIEATAGLLADYPPYDEWLRTVRGRSAAERLERLGV